MMVGVTNALPKLPQGLQVGNKPEGLEFIGRTEGKYVNIIETLKVIDTSKTIQFSTIGKSKNQIAALKAGINHAAKRMQFKHKIKFTLKDDVMHVWCNR